MDAEIAKKLREKFDVKQIGLKPKITCRACSKSPTRECGEHKKQSCRECGQWITPRHMHVEFVGHANVTDRLLEVDPTWSWEPVGFDQRGLPALDANGGLWIRLTVAGVTRIGYGGADGKEGDDAVKEAISDAIKVTAMRFGVGLDLWRKEEASGKTSDEPSVQRQNGAPTVSQEAREALEELAATCDSMGYHPLMVAKVFADEHKGANIRNASTPQHAEMVRKFIQHLDDVDPTRLKAPAGNGAQA